MAISKTPEKAAFPVGAVHEIEPAVERFSSIPTAADIKSRYLFGIPLVSALTGEKLSDDAIEFYIKSAISELEHLLDLYITPVEFEERYDYKRHNFNWNYNFLNVNHSPILTVTKLELSFSNNAELGMIEFPLEFVYAESQSGVVQLVPAFGTAMSGFLISAFTGVQFHALAASGMIDFPGGIRITYIAGFEPCKVPVAIVNLIGLIAAINLLSILGPITFPFNSTSVGIDGVSQSNSTMGPQYFNSRIQQLTAERDREIDTVKGYYQKKFLIDYV